MRRQLFALRLEPDVLEALQERADSFPLQPCGKGTVARYLLRQALGLLPAAPREAPTPEPPANAVVELARMVADAQAARAAAIEAMRAATAKITDAAPRTPRPAQRTTGGHRQREAIPKGARCTGCHELFPFDCIGGADCRGKWEMPPPPQAEDDFPTIEGEVLDPW